MRSKMRTSTQRLFSLTITALLVLGALPVAAAATDTPPPPPGAKDRCPVCGMMVSYHKAWVAAIVFTGGKRVYFDGPKDLFRYYFDLAKFEKNLTVRDIASIWVTEYYAAKLVDARSALFVIGSDVLGPMGHELVPVAGNKEADSFRKDHHGKKIIAFADITQAVVAEIE